MKRFKLYTTHFSQVDKSQYYIWDTKCKFVVARVYHGGVKMASQIANLYERLVK